MATWTFDDGSMLRSGGLVKGAGAAAQKLREVLACTDRCVQVAPIPMRAAHVDLSSDYLLDVIARDVAFRVLQAVRTDYEARDEDIPEEVRELLAAAERSARDAPPGRVF